MHIKCRICPDRFPIRRVSLIFPGRDDNGCNDIHHQSSARQERERNETEADQGGIHVEIFADASAHPGDHPVVPAPSDLFHGLILPALLFSVYRSIVAYIYEKPGKERLETDEELRSVCVYADVPKEYVLYSRSR